MAWLVAGAIAFVLAGRLYGGTWIMVGLFMVLGMIVLVDAVLLYRLGVPVLQRELATRPQIGQPLEVWLRGYTQFQRIEGSTHPSIWHRMIVDFGLPQSFELVEEATFVPIGEEGQLVYRTTVIPHVRGLFSLAPVDASWRSPLGLWTRLTRYEQPGQEEEILVLPDITSWQKGVYELQRTLVTEGQHVKRLAAGTLEFAHIGDYTPDDNWRQINWAATARRNRLQKNVYQPERGQHIIVAVDASRYMNVLLPDGLQRIDLMVATACALAHAAMGAGDSVGLCAFTSRMLVQLPPGRGPLHWKQIVQSLGMLKAESAEGGYEALFRSLSGRFHRRSLLIILSELEGAMTDTSLASMLTSVKHRHPTLFVTLANVQALQRLRSVPMSDTDVTHMAAAQWVVRDRESSKQEMRRQGVDVLESMPGDVAVDSVREYLKRRHRYAL